MQLSKLPGLALIARRPWVLVVIMFAILLVMWVSIYTISVRHPIEKLDAQGEREVLIRRAEQERQP